MKEESPKDIFETQCWLYKVIDDPYQVFANCFALDDISSYRKTIQNVLFSVLKKKIFRRQAPANLLFDFKIIYSVIIAASHINQQKKKDPIDFSFVNLMDKAVYCGKSGDLNEWDFFPRALSKQEYKDPYLVLKRFFKYHSVIEWKHEIDDMLDFALSSCIGGMDLNLLALYFHLVKLMEAVHLIDVREITHVDGYFKRLPLSPVTKNSQ